MTEQHTPTLTAIDAIREELEQDGTVPVLLQTGQIDAALRRISRTITQACRDRSAEMFLDSKDRYVGDALAQRIIRHPLFSYEEKETLLEALPDPLARAGMAVVIGRADLILRATAQHLALLLLPDTPTQ